MSTHLPPVEEAPKVAQLAAWFVLAGVGGVVKYVSAVLKSPERVSHRRFLALLAANAFISAFCGLIGMLVVSTMTPAWQWHGVAAGLFGYLGTTGLDWLLLALKKKIEPLAPASAVIPVPPAVDAEPK